MERIFQTIDHLKARNAAYDPITLCKHLDIDILHLELGDILGFKTNFYGVSLIYVNQLLSPATARFIVAHELGHILLHQGIQPLFTQYLAHDHFISQFENEANQFAIILLLWNYYLTYRYEEAPEQLMDQIGLPTELRPLFLDTFEQLVENKQRLLHLLT